MSASGPSIGSVRLDAPFFQAGLAGYSDAAMRLVARRHGAPYCVTEAMLDQFLIAGGKGLRAAQLDEADHPIAGQLMGSHPREIARGAAILVKLGYDVVDVNLACPVKKVRRKSRGGHLLELPQEAIAILDAVRQAVSPEVPCTVKLRRGSDDSALAERNFRAIFEAAMRLGYAAAVVHGRTVEQKYVGPSRWEFLRSLVREYGNARKSDPGMSTPPAMGAESGGMLIGGSGDVWTARDVFAMIERTGVQLVSVARGCIGNPWLFEQARALLRGDPDAADRPPTIAQQRRVLLEHFELSVRLHGEERAAMMMRKFGIKFSRHHPQKAAIARAFVAVQSLGDWRAVLERFYAQDGPGARADMSVEALHSCESAAA